MVTEYESGKAIPNQQILAKMERALGWKLHFHFHMKPNYFWIDHAIDVHSHNIPHPPSGIKLRGKDKGKPLEAKASGDYNLNFNQLTYNC